MTMLKPHIACDGASSMQALCGKLLFPRLTVLLCLTAMGLIDARAIAQEFVEEYGWRTATGSTVLTLKEEKAKAARPGSEFKECARGCPVMIVIPAGKFIMGSPENERARAMQIAMAAAVHGVSNTRRPLDRLSRMRLGFTTCTATSGSGLRIPGTRTTTARQRTDQHGCRAAIQAIASSAGLLA